MLNTFVISLQVTYIDRLTQYGTESCRDVRASMQRTRWPSACVVLCAIGHLQYFLVLSPSEVSLLLHKKQYPIIFDPLNVSFHVLINGSRPLRPVELFRTRIPILGVHGPICCIVGTDQYGNHLCFRIIPSVADPGCLSRIRIFLIFRIQSQKDSGSRSGSASKNLSILNQKTVSNLFEIWSGLFISDPDPGSGFATMITSSCFRTGAQQVHQHWGGHGHSTPEPGHDRRLLLHQLHHHRALLHVAQQQDEDPRPHRDHLGLGWVRGSAHQARGGRPPQKPRHQVITLFG